ncbi:MAG TPA: orotidine-5'-phosphate decarboxylase [Verrucomicrobiales bacterium]|jgi:orotidine-5'-phosphate decarboxylase|nr:orotidine-5'-phosphate decarboxylase [Verrucomicrobiales bacterium]HIL71714.1 orotidine-5'-phosphate decarboxylase [Verrucomicrobiota bacterium]
MVSDNNFQKLSKKDIPNQDRLIFALDVPTVKDAEELVDRLGDSVSFYKLGLQLFMAGGYHELVGRLRDQGKRIMVDLKFFDVPKTVQLAVEGVAALGADFTTVHGNDDILKAAVSVKGDTKILAVTVLTSLDQNDLKDLGFQCEVEDLVRSRASRALEIGCDGVVSSGLEAEHLRASLGHRFLVVTPGIRPFSNSAIQDDQKRVVTVEDAFRKGADHIVVGRPIKSAPDPHAKALEIQQQIKAVFQSE